jgi:hypothetical protein
MVIAYLRRLLAGRSMWKPEFASGSVRVGFVVDKVALGQVFFRVLVFPCQYHSTVALLGPSGHRVLVVNTPDSYSEGFGFKSWLRDRLS